MAAENYLIALAGVALGIVADQRFFGEAVFVLVGCGCSGAAAGAARGGGSSVVARVDVQAWIAGEKQALLAC